MKEVESFLIYPPLANKKNLSYHLQNLRHGVLKMPDSSRKKPIIDSKFIYKSLNMEMSADQENRTFSSINMAMDAKKDGVAVVMRRTDSDMSKKMIDILTKKYRNAKAAEKITDKQILDLAEEYELHELADYAIKKGARLLITKAQIKNYPCLIVPSENAALFSLAACYVKLFDTRIIQITGSFGKTSMWQLIYHVLTVNGKNVHRNALNGNDHRKVINAIFDLEYAHEFYVQETQEGPVSWVVEEASKMLKPEIGIITNIGATHLEHMQTKDNIARCMLKIQEGMPPNSLLILNGDDHLLKMEARNAKVPTVYYGTRYINADYLATNIQHPHDGVNFNITYGENKSQSRQVKMAMIGEHNAYNALAVFAACKKLGLTDDEIINGIESFKPEGIRQNLTTVNGRTLYLDCYNASIETMTATIKILSETALERKAGRRVAILGNINELGSQNEMGHKQVGYAVLQSNIDILICYGRNAAFIAEIAQENPDIKIFKTEDFDHLIALIREETKPGDFILVKASRGAYMEVAVDAALGTYFGFDAEEGYKSSTNVMIGDFEVNINTHLTTITGYVGTDSHVNIPYKLNGNVVFGIGKEAFVNNNSIKAVMIPQKAKVIGERAFCGCTKLHKVVVPNSVTNIGSDAFANSPCVIYGRPGSFAESYANENSIAFMHDVEQTIADVVFKPVNVEGINDSGELVLINHQYSIENIPEKSKLTQAELFVSVVQNDTVFANKQVLKMAKQMLNTAKRESVGVFYAVAGYRSIEEQQMLHEQNAKDGTTAKPWHSEHHTGLALDIFSSNDMVKSNGIARENTPQFKWLADNAHRFGFILRYPVNKQDITGVPYEPWHFRYVGRVHAYYMWQNELVLEEYISLLKAHGQMIVNIYGSEHYVFYQVLENDFIRLPQNGEYDVSNDNTGGCIITVDAATL